MASSQGCPPRCVPIHARSVIRACLKHHVKHHASIMHQSCCMIHASIVHQACIKHASSMHQACIKHHVKHRVKSLAGSRGGSQDLRGDRRESFSEKPRPTPDACRPPLCHSSSQAPKTSTPSHAKQSLPKPGVAQVSGSADARPDDKLGAGAPPRARPYRFQGTPGGCVRPRFLDFLPRNLSRIH